MGSCKPKKLFHSQIRCTWYKKAIMWYVYVQNMSKNVSKCINYDKMHLCLLYLFSPLSSIRTIFLSYRPGPLPLQKGGGTRGLPCCLNLIRSKSCMNRVKREKQNERRMHTIQEKRPMTTHHSPSKFHKGCARPNSKHSNANSNITNSVCQRAQYGKKLRGKRRTVEHLMVLQRRSLLGCRTEILQMKRVLGQRPPPMKL